MLDVDESERAHLDALSEKFMAALEQKDRGLIDAAEDALRAILRSEPRLAEPRLELARILLDTDRLDEAEDHAREAVDLLVKGGQWTDDLPEAVVQAIGHGTLAEILRRKADEDDVIFGDPDVFREMVREAQHHFAKAAELDPSEDYSSYHAFFLGLPGAQIELGEAKPPAGVAPRTDRDPIGEA